MGFTRSRRARLAVATSVAVGLIGSVLGGVGGAAPSGHRSEIAVKAGTPIKLMVLGSFSGGGTDLGDIPDAAKAAAKAINRAGGVDGNSLSIIVCDHGFDPNEAAACAREAVDEEVAAVVGAYTASSDQYLPVLEKAGIPSVAPYAIGFPELTSTMSFPIAGGIVSGTAGIGAVLADAAKVKSIDVSFLDIPGGAGKFAATLVDLATEPRGLPESTSTPEPPGGADRTPSVQATIDKESQGVALATVDPEFSKWILAYRQAGGEAKLATAGATVTPDNLDTLGDAIEGVYISNNYKPASLKSDPGVKQMLREVKAFGKKIPLNDFSIGAWAGVHVVAEALAEATTLDAAGLVSALNTDREWDPLVSPPVNFTKPSPDIAASPLLSGAVERLFNIDVYYSQVKKGKIKAIGSTPHNPLSA